MTWAAAISAEGRERFPRALGFVESLEKRGQLQLHEQAFKGMLLLRNGRVEQAQKLLASVRNSLKESTCAEAQYTRRYAQYYLAMIRTEPAQAAYEARQAHKIDCRATLKQWLWLPAEADGDRLDVEYDKWVIRNSPGEK